MSRVRVESFTISVDGFGARANLSLENPLGVGGTALHGWAFTTRSFRQMFRQDGGDTGVHDRLVARGFDNVGAWLLGRNMFGPVRGAWQDESLKGGDTPPYRCTAFVLTHHPRKPLEMDRRENGGHDERHGEVHCLWPHHIHGLDDRPRPQRGDDRPHGQPR
ncbi:hypothetical protein [Urbifossiella limnaea]|uniref:Dihydrofolate reductase n=1 Tax=Urbifossiella limnaea TaxID=2528023 RepID=A0A517Y1A6_9BACT|nr:hypothetical protein [Urbifossiella limnaea]QDU23556.1 hypothetical protein ETAA1_55570 [Urbifossiella limnaea]